MDRRWVLVVLFVSLALNVFIIGGLVGAGLAGVKLRPPPPAATPRGGMGQAIRALPPEQQQAWRAGNRDFMASNGPKFREARELSREAMRRFGDEPFARDAILADLKQARSLEFEARVAQDQRVVDFAAGLPPDQRRVMARALARPPLGRRGPRGPDGGRPPLPDR
jgi:uncharacterized membrane protein